MVDTLRYIYLKDTSKIYWFWSLLEFERQLIFSSNWCQSMIDLALESLQSRATPLPLFACVIYIKNIYFYRYLYLYLYLYLPASSTSRIFTFSVIFIIIFICLRHLHQESWQNIPPPLQSTCRYEGRLKINGFLVKQKCKYESECPMHFSDDDNPFRGYEEINCRTFLSSALDAIMPAPPPLMDFPAQKMPARTCIFCHTWYLSRTPRTLSVENFLVMWRNFRCGDILNVETF